MFFFLYQALAEMQGSVQFLQKRQQNTALPSKMKIDEVPSQFPFDASSVPASRCVIHSDVDDHMSPRVF